MNALGEKVSGVNRNSLKELESCQGDTMVARVKEAMPQRLPQQVYHGQEGPEY